MRQYVSEKPEVKTRCCKYSFAIDGELEDFFRRIHDAKKELGNLIFQKCQKMTSNEFGTNRALASYVDSIYKECLPILKKYDLGKTKYHRCVTKNVVHRYSAYMERFKGLPPKFPISIISDRGVSLYAGIITDKNPDSDTGLLVFDLGNKKHAVHYNIDKYYKANKERIFFTLRKNTGKFEPDKKKKPGGNITKNDNGLDFTVQTKVPIKWKYTPTKSLGFDINKSRDAFIYFSDKIEIFGKKTDVIQRPLLAEKWHSNVEKWINLINNNTIDPKTNKKKYNTKQRKVFRKNWILNNQRLENVYRPICEEILKYTENNKMLLCIDNNSAGGMIGAFGNDKVIKYLIQQCENRGIPFVVVPTPYTSQRCYSCGKIDPESRNGDNYKCIHCGFNTNSHENAALNIAWVGWQAWTKGKYQLKKT